MAVLTHFRPGTQLTSRDLNDNFRSLNNEIELLKLTHPAGGAFDQATAREITAIKNAVEDVKNYATTRDEAEFIKHEFREIVQRLQTLEEKVKKTGEMATTRLVVQKAKYKYESYNYEFTIYFYIKETAQSPKECNIYMRVDKKDYSNRYNEVKEYTVTGLDILSGHIMICETGGVNGPSYIPLHFKIDGGRAIIPGPGSANSNKVVLEIGQVLTGKALIK